MDTTFSQASLELQHAMPGTRLASSVDAGWTSVLLEHRSTRGTTHPFDLDATPDQQLVLLTHGGMDLEGFDGTSWHKGRYQVGSGGLIPHASPAHLRWRHPSEASSSRVAHLYIPRAVIDEAAEHYRAVGYAHRDVVMCSLAFHDPTIAQAVFSLLRAMTSGAPDLYAGTMTAWLSRHLLAKHSSWASFASEERSPGVIADRRLARVLELMSVHYAEPLSLDRLAREAAVSKFHFSRMFRERTGRTPHGHLVDLRMDAARRLLATTDLTVAEVAAACGYENPAHFGTAFARRFGATPRAFRRRDRF